MQQSCRFTLYNIYIRFFSFFLSSGKKEFNFLPLTYILPQEMKQLKRDWDEGKGKAKWIVKPVSNPVSLQCIVGQNNQESRLEYWATRSSVRSFARTAHSFACSALVALLACSTALICLLACSLTPELVGKLMIRWLFLLFFSVMDHSG